MLAGAAKPREIYGASDYLGRVVKGATNKLNPGILPTNPERPLVNPPQTPPQQAGPEPDPEEGKYFNEELKQKIKDYLTLATVEVGVGAFVTEVLQKEAAGQITPGEYVSATFFYLSCQGLTHKHILMSQSDGGT